MQPHEELSAAGLDPAAVADIVDRAIAEDLDGGVDVTSVATVDEDAVGTLDLVARARGVTAGAAVAALALAQASQGRVTCSWIDDGTRVEPGDVVLTASGPTRDLLLGERTALNLLGHLSGIATATRQWVDALGDSPTRVRDTRKTTPGLRRLEKYAVRCGGGVNHRMSLSDAALVKDNHVISAGGVAAAFARVREAFPGIPVEVEVDSLDQLDEVLVAGADLVLLDNFTPEQMREAVRRTAGRAQLEASGGLTLADASAVGATGVDFVAVGALTHSAPVLDIGADLREAQ
ncbi:MAG: carboxylating nicotinate-nucleotide diphosphorylase [Actinobacteria bacterium]|nr:carboxylating nicotinate-nucleotide diphosphorylase [Actinomycetota bacterium]